METYATALLIAIPVFLILVIIEILYSHYTKKQFYSLMDTVSSLSSGITNIIKDTLGLAVILVSYPFLLKNLAVFEMQASPIVYIIAFIIVDFAGYWNHRLCHKVNIFWNQHVIHHSSEEFNLACALRQSVSNIIGYFPLLLIPAAVLGVPEKVINIVAPIQLFAQFWYHTRHIGKLGWLEYIIVTPSQHRVHHAINPEYIDKNLGQIFCVWDRMFGTFQEERKDIPPVYGVLKPAGTWNPMIINFQHFWRIFKDAWRTKNWLDKLKVWFMPTGWRPDDVKKQYPVETIKNVYSFKKYATPSTPSFSYYAVFQLLGTTFLLLFLLYNFGNLTTQNLWIYGFYIFLSVFGYTSFMDGTLMGIVTEIVRSLTGIGIILFTGDWFGINASIPYGNIWIMLYFAITIVATLYFSSIIKKQTSKLAL